MNRARSGCRTSLAILLASALAGSPAGVLNAADGDLPPIATKKLARIAQAGIFEIGQGDSSAVVGLELRFDRVRPDAAGPARCSLDPRVGILLTTNGAAYLYAGAGLAVRLPARCGLTVGLDAGLYENRQDVDLGGPVEFRTSLELARELPGSRRLGAVFQHLSNASLYKHNPGVNSLLVTWSF